MIELPLLHPSPDRLAAFGLGRLSDVEASEIERHLVTCGTCRTVVEELPNDEFIVMLQGPAPGVETANSVAPIDSKSPKELGEFSIIREIGRGGMGIVYEAEQISLGRRVALKVLPFAATLDPRQLQRFKREAQAAALLHHTNIVPVHAVGCERGVHYYAMQYIDGHPLAHVIHELRLSAGLEGRDGAGSHDGTGLFITKLASGPWLHQQSGGHGDGQFAKHGALHLEPTRSEHRACSPAKQFDVGPSTASPASPDLAVSPTTGISTSGSTKNAAFFRTIANLGVQAAEGLEHAHSLGVLHRDIKPSNLLIDVHGNLWITDFGLARLDTDAGLTMTGDLMGTLRYMSPEQALAKRVLVDQRTDIYSLGATLYELLTLQPAFRGRDRQEVLRQIAFEEPKPPRRLNKSIPAELETIVLKAMAKNPAERYATAQELGDDLHCFLEDKPIRARQPTMLQRLTKWSRRHKPVVATVASAAVLLLVLAVLGLGTSNMLIMRQKQKTEDALAERTESLEREQHTAYFQRIARADLEWWANNVGRAEQLLDECPPAFRHWEWRYLKRLCHTELFTLKGHSDAVRRVTFSPNGRYLASASDDKTARVWDLMIGKEVLTLPHADVVVGIAFSPDSSSLAIASGLWSTGKPGELVVREIATGDELFTLKGHQRPIWSIAFSPDGTRLASASIDNTVRLWDAANGAEILRIDSTNNVTAVAFSPDGSRLAAGNYDRTIRIHDIRTGSELFKLDGHPSDVRSVAFSPDGRRLVSNSFDGTTKLWDLAERRAMVTVRGHRGVGQGVAFSPDGSRFATASSDGSAKLWSSNGRELATLRGHSGAVTGVAFSPSGRCVATASWDRTIKLWDITSDPQARELGRAPWGISLCFSRDSRWLAAALRVEPGSASQRRGVHVWETATGRQKLLLPVRIGGYNASALSSNGKLIATDWGSDAKIWDTETGDEILSLTGHSGPVTSVAFSPNDQRLASASEDKTIKIWDVAREQPPIEICTLAGHDRPVRAVMFSPDGRRVVSASDDHTVRVWDVDSRWAIVTFRGHNAAVIGITVSPDGQRIASASDDQTVKVWQAETGDEQFTLPHVGHATGVAYSHDGQRLVSVSGDGNLTIWDAQTGQEALNLRKQLRNDKSTQNSRFAVAFSPDGRYLAAGSAEGTAVKIWDGGEPIEQLTASGGLANDSRLLAWHVLEAAGCEDLKNWPAAIGHLTRLIDENRGRPALYARRARAFAELNQLEHSKGDYTKAVALHDVFATDPDDRWLLSSEFYKLGLALNRANDREGAEQALRIALGIREKVLQASTDAADHRSGLATVLGELGVCLRDQGRLAEAYALLERAIAEQQTAANLQPTQATFRQLLADRQFALAELLAQMGDYTRAAQAAENLPRISPKNWREYHRAARFFKHCSLHADLAEATNVELQTTALHLATRARDLWQEAIRHHSKQPDALNRLAWQLATDPDSRLREAELALEAAKGAVQRAPDNRMYVNTLAAAYYRTGHYRAAIETLEPIRADAFSAFDLYFAAMAYHQLGDPSKARRSFDRAIASHEAHGPHLSQSYREELRRFRAEAAELLEVSANDPMVDQ